MLVENKNTGSCTQDHLDHQTSDDSTKSVCYSPSLSFLEFCCKKNDKRIKASVRYDVYKTEIAILVKFLPNREQMLDFNKHISLEDDESIDKNKVNKISKLSTTRWTVCVNCFQKTIDNYQYLCNLRDESLKETGVTTEVKSRMIGYKAQMTTFELYFELTCTKRENGGCR